MATVTQQEYQNAKNAVSSTYTADSLNSYRTAYNNYISQGMNSKDAANKASSLLVKSNVGTTTSGVSSSSNNTMSNTSKATNTSNTNKTSPYEDQGPGNYSYNPATGYYEKQGGNNQTSTPANSNISNAQNYWNNLTYEQQQEKMNQTPGLKDAINKKGWTIKSPNAQGTQPTQQQTANPGQWDYQDNSDARMMEIANNLNGYRVSNPDLFNDWGTFSNFFINGKGRSQEQIDYLKDYFNAVKQYNSYDNMAAPTVGEMVAKGQIPEGYLNYIKYANPDRYAEIMSYKDQTEKGIMNETYYANLVNNSDLADPEWMKWAKENQFIIDENNDNLDDRLYHEATDEEKTLVNEYSTLASEQLADQNTYRDLMSDLREQYPDADESTLMILAGDRGKKIQDRMDTRNVTMTKLNGQITYLQNERTTQNTAGQQTITQLQKAYGMYYDYSPEGMAELAQAQYAATNVTLDQADNGTDTQKQMALENVLDGYYDKYGAIIQRSEQQVIGDVMKYAKDNGVSLSQALEENFLKPLRAKPGFNQLSTITSNPDVVRIGTDANGNPIYGTYNSATGQFNPISLSSLGLGGDYSYGGTGGTATTPGGVKYTTVSDDAKVGGLSNFLSGLNVGDYGGWCGAFVNDYLESIGAGHIYDNDLSTKLNSINVDPSKGEMPSVGDVAVFDFSKAPASSNISADAKKYGHVAIVVGVDDQKGTVTIVESNKDGNKLIGEPRELPISNAYLKGYFNPSKGYDGSAGNKGGANNFGGKFSGSNDWNNNGYFNSLARDLQGYIENGKLKIPDKQYESLKQTYGINDQEFRQMAANYANAELKTSGGSQASEALKYAVKVYELLYGNQSGSFTTNWLARSAGQIVPGTDQEKAKNEYNSLMKRLTLKELFDAKALGATFGAMSDSEWSLLQNAATDLNWYNSNFKQNLSELIESLYDAAVDGKATLPSNFAGSGAEQMIKTIKAEGSGIGGGKFNQNGSTNDIYSDLF